MGLEIEFIPVRADDHKRIPLESPDDEPSGIRLLRAAARDRSWTEEVSRHGVPQFRIPGTGTVTFEPGGQLELSTLAFDAVGPLVAASRQVLGVLLQTAGDEGIELVARGIDPYNAVDEARLFVPADRYVRQYAHYERRGPWGRRMMLQSAAIHVNLDLGGRPVRRWWAANRMAPYLTALFANSPVYEGRETAVRSQRAEQWRNLDPSRTGVFPDTDDPVAAYTAFALRAENFITVPEDRAATPFRKQWEEGTHLRDWKSHLTTLFPEVRPRGYLELRSVDTLPTWWMAVPLVVAVGALYGPRSLTEVEETLPVADLDSLRTAGREGLGDATIRRHAEALFDIALAGAGRLGREVVDGASLDEARAFRERFVARGEDPGHESHPASGR